MIITMDISELKTTAELANLGLTEEELCSLGNEVEKMLNYFSKMQEADALLAQREKRTAANQDAGASSQAACPSSCCRQRPGTQSVRPARMRCDQRIQEINPDVLLERAPELEDRFIVIPNVL